MTLQTADTPESAPLTETPETITETPEPAVSIADHASQFSPDRAESEDAEIPKTPANTGQFANKPPDARHRASTQRATPEDVQEINKLTKELREAEQRLADKDPDAKASPRVKTLRRQLAALKALEAPAPAKTETTAAPVLRDTSATSEFADKEPEIEDFANDPDPYKAWTKAQIKWEAKRDRFEATQQQRTAEAEQRYQQETSQAHERVEAFAQSKPDFDQVVGKIATKNIGPLLVKVVTVSDKGPEFVYHLAQHPDLLDELVFETHDKPITDTNVAVLQRRLTQALSQGQAVSTGSVAPARPYTPPKPPNPVRTGPIKTADEPPDQAGSIAEHRKHFGPK